MFVVGISGFKPVIGQIDANGLAEQSGLKTGYEIVAINNNKTPIWDVATINIISSIVERSKAELLLKDKNGFEIKRVLDFSNTSGEIKIEKLFKQLGFRPWQPAIKPIIGSVGKDTPAEKAGFKKGDIILRVNDIATPDWSNIVEQVSSKPVEVVSVLISREGKNKTLKVTPKKIMRNGEAIGQIGVGPKSRNPYPKEMQVEHGYGILDSIPKAFVHTWDFTVLNLKMMAKFFTGEISIKNLSGPVSIARYAGYSASAGLARFLEFLALVSISLGIINLLPIPILDGGHLTYYLIEVVRKKPVSDETQEFASRIGMVLLFSLMIVALYYDILRVVA